MNSPTTTVRAGQTWTDCERGLVRVIAVADGYAMLKRRRRNPFLASTDQMLAGEYGWQLAEHAACDREQRPGSNPPPSGPRPAPPQNPPSPGTRFVVDEALMNTLNRLASRWLLDDGYLTGNPEIDEPTIHRGAAKRECAQDLLDTIATLRAEQTRG